MLLPGDLSYADDYNLIDKFGYQPRWDTWGRLTQSTFATIPLVTGIGASTIYAAALKSLSRGRARGPGSRSEFG